jgi:N-acetylneuraminate synthase
MQRAVPIGSRLVGDGEPCFIVAEIGINHNGDINIAKQLIDVAVATGCDAVKFQKRTVELLYPQEELDQPYASPFGNTVRALREGRELKYDDYASIDEFCAERGISWFASCWDHQAVDFIQQFSPPAFKIASASLIDDALLRYIRAAGKPVVLSTGMSTQAQIDHAVEVLGREDLILLHCTSIYPARPEQLNLRMIPILKQRYGVPVGYSGHEVGLQTTVAAVALGASLVERHITLDRAMWGTDQAASVEPQGFARLVRDIRAVESAMGDGNKCIYGGEIESIKRLRRAAARAAESETAMPAVVSALDAG